MLHPLSPPLADRRHVVAVRRGPGRRREPRAAAGRIRGAERDGRARLPLPAGDARPRAPPDRRRRRAPEGRDAVAESEELRAGGQKRVRNSFQERDAVAFP